MKRFVLLVQVPNYDFIFIHRETMPVGPPIIEWMISKIFRKKLIYDFDDAIWLTDKVNESAFDKILRWRSKAASICRWSHKVSCGNPYLAAYARRFNSRVVVNPTTIDTENIHNPRLFTTRSDNRLTIGWTGSYSTLKYLKTIETALQRIQRKYPDVRILVIADRPPRLNLKYLEFRKWFDKTEIQDLSGIDIGLMPLPDDEWTKGKCGFKALQYMALEIPAVVSPVGVNTEIVEDGVHGYWCTTENEWFSSIERLILDKALRLQMGRRGRERVIERYSVLSNSENFLSLFQ